MTMLIIGLLVFFGNHSISIVALDWRDAMAERIGKTAWRILYGVISLVGLVLIVKGYGAARLSPEVVWVPPTWTSHVTAVLMLPVFSFALASVLQGRISAALKHPLLVATKLWAVAHLIANGMLADILLFGSFLAWAVVDRISLKRRPAVRKHPAAPASAINDVIVVVGGLALYAAFVMYLHVAWIGVNPIG